MDEKRFDLSVLDLADLLGLTRPETLLLLQKHSRKIEGASKVKQPTSVPPAQVRRILETQGARFERRSIAFQVVKGGVGKTTLAKNFGVRAAQYGYKVLFIDMDHQANLTFSLDKFNPENPVWIDLVRGKVAKAHELVLPISENISLIPSSLSNARLDSELVTSAHNLLTVVARPVEQLKKDFDLIVIDCPPALGPTVSAVYLGVDDIVAPVIPDKFSEMGVDFMCEEWGVLADRFEKQPQIHVLINRHDPRIRSSNEQLVSLVNKYEDMVLPHYIKASSDFLSANNSGQHLWELKRQSSAAADVDLVVRSLLALTELGKRKKRSSARSKSKSTEKQVGI